MPEDHMRVAVFASGNGTDFLALVKASQMAPLGWEVALLITNNPQAGAIEKAQDNNIPYQVIDRRDFEDGPSFLTMLLAALDDFAIDFIALAGYLRKIPPEIIRRYRHRIVNIHPALLPAFGGKGMYGAKVHQTVIDAGCKVTGVTVHFVSEQYDEGRIIVQRCVPVKDDDDADTLAARVLAVEHRLYPEVVTLFANNRIQVLDNKIKILDP
ncbi:MAG: phosphoribosylglycinamide formyltransferase [FCB group bacterium]|nr:phosphoribosylglycinamide formyltransferase [FCB group bacterium]